MTKKPISQRILLSSLFSVPIDTFVFLSLVDMFDWTAMLLVSIAKFAGAVGFWYILRQRERRPALSGAN